MTKYEIAKRLNVSHQAVYKWYNGKSFPSMKNLIALAKLQGKTVEKMVEELTT